jgi:hypothetical protein
MNQFMALIRKQQLNQLLIHWLLLSAAMMFEDALDYMKGCYNSSAVTNLWNKALLLKT